MKFLSTAGVCACGQAAYPARRSDLDSSGWHRVWKLTLGRGFHVTTAVPSQDADGFFTGMHRVCVVVDPPASP